MSDPRHPPWVPGIPFFGGADEDEAETEIGDYDMDEDEPVWQDDAQPLGAAGGDEGAAVGPAPAQAAPAEGGGGAEAAAEVCDGGPPAQAAPAEGGGGAAGGDEAAAAGPAPAQAAPAEGGGGAGAAEEPDPEPAQAAPAEGGGGAGAPEEALDGDRGGAEEELDLRTPNVLYSFCLVGASDRLHVWLGCARLSEHSWMRRAPTSA